jgi:hypothetical protein
MSASFLDVFLETRQDVPALVTCRLALAGAGVQVGAANGTEPGACLTAKRLQRLTHEDILPKTLPQIEPELRVDAESLVVRADVDLRPGVGIDGRDELLLEMDRDGCLDIFEAARALLVEPGCGVESGEEAAVGAEEFQGAAEVVEDGVIDDNAGLLEFVFVDGTELLAEFAKDMKLHGKSWGGGLN